MASRWLFWRLEAEFKGENLAASIASDNGLLLNLAVAAIINSFLNVNWLSDAADNLDDELKCVHLDFVEFELKLWLLMKDW